MINTDNLIDLDYVVQWYVGEEGATPRGVQYANC